MGVRVLVVYHSEDGQTAKIADRIAAALTAAGASAGTATTDGDPSPAGYDGVIVGGSIRLGRHSRSLRRWLTHHADTLDRMPTALFQVSLTSDDPEHDDEAHQLLQRLLDGTGLDPDIVGVFAGALAYTSYGWIKRRVMHHIAASEGVPTSTDHELTDGEAVDRFAADALALINGTTEAQR